ncbi:MAG: UDP-N-acetylmuramoyl-tripeptide--D-alanyl-D-alanine ligase [Candidatus Omnitrophica bacterium]|nr:UDP-N-acetylmuramoyl-tripeptide--D-alanyl-D-alanine ligase [Candidatus Omnitrophota bacterium]
MDIKMRISTDTRTIEKGDFFVALKGPHFDGHDFIGQALEKGVRHFLVSEKADLRSFGEKARFVRVPDTLKAYGDLANAHRRKFSIPVVAITGSVGKTTVKELLAHFLEAKFNVLKNQGTENNLIGVPKTILELKPEHQALVLELGTNQPGEIERLSSIAEPTHAVITRIGQSHLEGLKNIEGVKREKLGILKGLRSSGAFFVNGEDPYLKGAERSVPVMMESGVWHAMPLLGRHNQVNAEIAMAVARALGMDEWTMKERLRTFAPVKGRLELKEIAGIYFIDDTYNSNPVSLDAALQTLDSLKILGEKGLVLGDMLELGAESEKWHRQVGASLARFAPDFVIAAGPLCRHLVDEAIKMGFDRSRIQHAASSEEAGRLCFEWTAPGDTVLVKGSRGMKMERVFDCFITSSTR